MDPALAALGEFGLIGLIRQRIQARTAGTLQGIGDDAAVLASDPGGALLVTTDMLLEGIHFQRRWGSPRELGRKALAVNVSDIAAMGGSPLYALLGLAIPSGGVSLAELEVLLLGLEEEAAAHGVTLVGGDTCASASGLVLSVTLIGRAPAEGPVLRSGARPGDSLWVTGTLGGSAAGLLALEQGFRPGQAWSVGLARPDWLGQEEEAAIQAALAAHLTPAARVAAGRALAGVATAMIDVSDGVASDANHLCSESRVGIRLQAGRMPIHPGARVMARLLGQEALDLALRGGEDYELLFAASADPVARLAEAAPGLPVTWVGEVTPGPPVPSLVHADGREEVLAGGFDHFRGSHLQAGRSG